MRPDAGCNAKVQMKDLVFVVITILFFVISIGYVHFCERVK
jgi:hypothetical protein